MPPPVNHQSELPADAVEQPEGADTGNVSDVSLALAVSDAVRDTPGVIDLSPGQTAIAATYGAGQRVTGVVVTHPQPDAVAIEVHTVVGGPELALTATTARPAPTAGSDEPRGILIDLAEQIRTAAHQVADVMLPNKVTTVDVFIDDLR